MRGCGSLGDVDALAPRWFVVRNARVKSPPILVQPRYAMSLMRGPMCMCALLRTDGVAPGTGTNTAFATSCQERGCTH